MSTYGNLFGQPCRPVKPKVFVSYHHDNDQRWYDQFTRLFADAYDLVTDRSLGACVESDDCEYVMRVIREQYLTGTSVTIVLCGNETWKRKYVDWEIKATLDKEHALLGIQLPTLIAGINGQVTVPDRLSQNIHNGYAHWIAWTTDPVSLSSAIQAARTRAANTRLIVNAHETMCRNRP